MIGTSGPSISISDIVDVEPAQRRQQMLGGRAERPLGIAQHGGKFGGGDGAHVGANFALDRAVGGHALENDAGVVVGRMHGERDGLPECTPTPETAIWSRNVVCLAPFIDLVPASSYASRAVPFHTPGEPHFCLQIGTPEDTGGNPRDQKVPSTTET